MSNHGHLLVELSRNPEARIRDLAQAVGITERSCQAIITDLQEAGYLTVTKQGRRNVYTINTRGKFRHPSEDSKPVGALIKIFE